MAKLPEWIECKKLYTKDKKIYAEIKLNYLPLRFFISFIIKHIGWKIWLYPKVIGFCLDYVGADLHAL